MYFRNRSLYSAIASLIFCTGYAAGCRQSHERQGKGHRLELAKGIEPDKSCLTGAAGLKLGKTCPPKNRLSPEEVKKKFWVTVRIDSPRHGFANIRSDDYFKGGYEKNLLIKGRHGARFCGRRRSSHRWDVLLKDSGGHFCKGFMASKLVRCARARRISPRLDCSNQAMPIRMANACPEKNSLQRAVPKLGTLRVESPAFCHANVRTDGVFREGYSKTLLTRVPHGQVLCGPAHGARE